MALSPTYWPLAWPSPEPTTLTLRGGACTVELPVRPPRPQDDALPAFAAPLVPPGLGEQVTGGGPGDRSYSRDLADDSLTWTYHYVDGGNVVLPNSWESEEWNTVTYRVREGDPLSASVRTELESVLRRGAQGRFHIVTRGEMTSDAGSFAVADAVTVSEGEEGDERIVFSREWRQVVPRDLV